MATINATHNKDTILNSASPTTNYGTANYIQVSSQPAGGGLKFRVPLHFTMPSDPGGTVTGVKLYLNQWVAAVTKDISVHELTRTDWVENQATWNVYKTSNSWTTAGGDYTGTAIDTQSVNTTSGWKSWDLGTTFNWGDEVHLILKEVSENNGTDSYKVFRSKEYATSSVRPYLEVTYTEGGGGSVKHQFLGFAGL